MPIALAIFPGKYKKIAANIPDLNRRFVSGALDYSKSNVRSGNIQVIKNIIASYGAMFAKWEPVFEIDRQITICFTATESGGKNTRPNQFKATGLMQMTPPAVFESIAKWRAVTKTDLPSEAVNFLNKKAPFLTKLNANSALFTGAQTATILNLLEKDSEFNIVVGCINLRWLLQKFGGQMNKVMVAYNAGAYNSQLRAYGSNVVSSDAMVNNTKIPLESRSYILKMLGVDGFLELIFKEDLL